MKNMKRSHFGDIPYRSIVTKFKELQEEEFIFPYDDVPELAGRKGKFSDIRIIYDDGSYTINVVDDGYVTIFDVETSFSGSPGKQERAGNTSVVFNKRVPLGEFMKTLLVVEHITATVKWPFEDLSEESRLLLEERYSDVIVNREAVFIEYDLNILMGFDPKLPLLGEQVEDIIEVIEKAKTRQYDILANESDHILGGILLIHLGNNRVYSLDNGRIMDGDVIYSKKSRLKEVTIEKFAEEISKHGLEEMSIFYEIPEGVHINVPILSQSLTDTIDGYLLIWYIPRGGGLDDVAEIDVNEIERIEGIDAIYVDVEPSVIFK